MIDTHEPAIYAWAEQALIHYTLDQPTIHFLGWHETLTFRVEQPVPPARFLLRIHRPRVASFVDMRQQPTAIESEIIWLQALAQDTAILAPRPLPATSGAYGVQIETDLGRLPCTLMQWIDGQPWPDDPQASRRAASALGRLLAQLHAHAQHWKAPPTMLRPVYDVAFVEAVRSRLTSAMVQELIAASDAAILQQTLVHCQTLVQELSRTPQTYGMIHADLHPGNCLLVGEQVCPIDFGLCGWGFFLFDLATSLGSLSVADRQPLLDAYARHAALSDATWRQIEAFFLISRMSAYGFALADTSQHAWLRQRVPQVVQTICLPFLKGDSFLLQAC